MPVVFDFLLSYYRAMKADSEASSLSSPESVASSAFLRISELHGVGATSSKEEMQEKLRESLKLGAEQGKHSLEMVEVTAAKIAAGGIHDHVGSGFHRYSVDRTWLVPHFEKMLYDQAQLLSVFSDLAAITKNPFYETVARDIIRYVERDLRDPGGAFYSAEDADSKPDITALHSKEGAFAVWEAEELDSILQADSLIFKFHFGVEDNGNVPKQFDPHNDLLTKNILIQRHTASETAAEFSVSNEEVQRILNRCLGELWKVRETRPKPHRDDKIMVAWNGLMISALAKAARYFNDEHIKSLAISAAHFIQNNMYDPEKKQLIRVFGTQINGYADDYSFLIDGLIELFQTTGDCSWIKWAQELQDSMDAFFWDSESGGYFTGSKEDEGVLLRLKDEYDGAEPTPSSVAIKNLLRLEAILGCNKYSEKVQKTLDANSQALTRAPRSLPAMVSGLLRTRDPQMQKELNCLFDPFSVLVRLAEGDESEWLRLVNPTLQAISEADDKLGCVFICENGVCSQPIDSLSELQMKV
ncbi:spermatogenesis-associated protein 20 [Entophlyctis sp. JEL0112]|nr:spermatogenesis-associated protein 20 [Entophlyctis sp. JEL0112]